MQALFQTQNLEFGGFLSYEDREIPAGKLVFLTGESGSGKSTFLKLCNGILSPSNGVISYLGEDIAQVDAVAHRRKVLLAAQEVFLFDGDIRSNFAEFHRYRGLPTPADSEIKRLLSLCALPMPLDKDAASMSGGERQRLYLSICLSFMPETLLLDEPTSALDAETGRTVMGNIASFCKASGMNLVAVSHDGELVKRFSEHTVVLKREAV